ncbi:baseplate J/gp47 family protein [Streptomyces sp. CBMA29]|uniref:baseplate J/gp47 family protein n=1 Tax=Streptomyces sp. CBMA29 TaxID=1896314 RepID=UPI001661CB45|nr:baseplate J/gp47 family protein [Streptomyces sp. CBMA29]MBD0734072.1 hypothetical protein [Streptomyces sp. CBMA29]
MADSTLTAQIDYTARDFTGYRDALFQHASRVFPEWTSRSAADFGVVLVEMLSYLGDISSFYQDRVADEAFLSTATQRSSVLAIASTLGYTPYAALAAIGSVTFQTLVTQTVPVTVPAGIKIITDFNYDLDRPVIYETDSSITVPASGGTASVTCTEGLTQGTREIQLVESSGQLGTLTVEDLGISTGEAGQLFVLSASPLLADTLRVVVEAADGATEWQYVTSLANASGADQVYATDVDDAGVVTVQFGDTVHGAIPATGLSIAAAYRVGGGAYGNIPANSIRDLATTVVGVTVAASSAMTGGADQEPIGLIRANAPRMYRTRDRAVARRDYADLALAIPGIAKASAVSQSATSVALYVMGPSNNAPSQIQRDQVTAYVRDRAVAGTQVLVYTGTLVPVNFGTASAPLLIGVNSRHRRAETLLACRQAVQNLLAPDSTDFGKRLPLSAVYGALVAVPGVDYAQITMMARADLAQTGTADIVCRPWEIPVVGTLSANAVGGI